MTFETKEQDEWYEKNGGGGRIYSHAVNVQAEVGLDRLGKAVQELLEKYADQENRLRNMANQLEEHLSTPDAHNPGMIYKK